MTSPADIAGLQALWMLARKGASAVPAAPPRRGDHVVLASSDPAAAALAVIAAADFARARERGWVAADADSERFRLTPVGLKALRQARSGQRAARPSRESEPRPARPRPLPPLAQEHPLAWLRRRKDKRGEPLITEPQLRAGERLAADFWHAQLMPRVTADWSGTVMSRRVRRAAPGVGVEISERVAAARQRVERALAAVGPELAGILIDVCCYEVGLEAAEQVLGWPQRSGKIVLQLGLTRLARHYGLIAPEPTVGAARLRHWGSEDYRPDIEAWR